MDKQVTRKLTMPTSEKEAKVKAIQVQKGDTGRQAEIFYEQLQQEIQALKKMV